MRKHAWWLVGAVAAVAWSLWLVFVLAAWGEGETEPADAGLWRTVYFVAACVLTGIASQLRRG